MRPLHWKHGVLATEQPRKSLIYVLYFQLWNKSLSSKWLFYCFHLSIVDLQCCVNFCSTAKWLSYTYIYTYSFLLWFITGYWTQFPVLYNRTLLFIHPIYNNLHLLISNSQLFPPPTPSCLASTSLFSMSESVSVLGPKLKGQEAEGGRGLGDWVWVRCLRPGVLQGVGYTFRMTRVIDLKRSAG